MKGRPFSYVQAAHCRFACPPAVRLAINSTQNNGFAINYASEIAFFTAVAVKRLILFHLPRIPMNNLSSSFTKLAAVVAFALTLGSCSRADYAMLPKGGSYHGTTRPTSSVAITPASTPAEGTSEVVSAVAPAQPIAAPTAVASAVTKSDIAAKPVTRAEKAAKVVAPATAAAEPTSAVVPAPKLKPLQRLALNKMTRKVDKLLQKAASVRQHDNTASTAKGSISGNLRIGIILLLVGLLISILNYFIGAIIAVIGLIFIVLWLLDQA